LGTNYLTAITKVLLSFPSSRVYYHRNPNDAHVPSESCSPLSGRHHSIGSCMTLPFDQVGALKQLQGHIWRTGFLAGDLQGNFFDDVVGVLKEMKKTGVKTYIYSSGSREAQRMFFRHTKHGDLRPLISGFFDTSSGMKVEASSYKNIQDSLGCDDPSQILFATDLHAEAEAALEAGWQSVLVIRPSNKPLPATPVTSTITSLQEIL